MFAGTLMTPRIDNKIRQSMFKHKKFQFKDVLRERFRDQIRANRTNLFGKIRSFDDSKEVQNSLNDILRNEIRQFDVAEHRRRIQQPSSSSLQSEQEFNHDVLLELMSEIEMELVDEQYKWILEEYRKEEEEIVSFYEEEKVLCPICQRGILEQKMFFDIVLRIYRDPLLSCTNCDLRLRCSLTLVALNKLLKQNVEEHSIRCSRIPHFWILNEGSANTLFMTCDPCSFVRVITDDDEM